MSEPRGRPFQPGNTLGRGRPKGSRNKSKSAGEDVLAQYGEHLMRKLIFFAMNGDRSAMRLCVERISPARRGGGSMRLSLPPIRTAQDVDEAAAKVTQDILRGRLSPADGATMMSIFESRSRIIEKGQMESRLQKLEEELAEATRLPRAA
jgi:hypothetical protein